MLVQDFEGGGCYVAVQSSAASEFRERDQALARCLPGQRLPLHVANSDEGRQVQVLDDWNRLIGTIGGEEGDALATAIDEGLPVRAVLNSVYGHRAGERRFVLLVDIEEHRTPLRITQWLSLFFNSRR